MKMKPKKQKPKKPKLDAPRAWLVGRDDEQIVDCLKSIFETEEKAANHIYAFLRIKHLLYTDAELASARSSCVLKPQPVRIIRESDFRRLVRGK